MSAVSQDRFRWRQYKDIAVRQLMSLGGLGVIIALCLIFVFIFMLVIPLFFSPKLEFSHSLKLPQKDFGTSHYLILEEQNQVAARVTLKGITFFAVKNGEIKLEYLVPRIGNATVTSVSEDLSKNGVFAFVMSNGQVMIVKVDFQVSYPNDKRLITPIVKFPFGDEPIKLGNIDIKNLAIQFSENDTNLAVIATQGNYLIHLQKEEGGFLQLDEEASSTQYELKKYEIQGIDAPLELLLEPAHKYLYILDAKGALTLLDISDRKNIVFLDKKQLNNEEQQVSKLSLLIGGISVLVAYQNGLVEQWFPIKAKEINLQKIREFTAARSKILDVQTEQRKKSFTYVSEAGKIFVQHTTSQRQIIAEKISPEAIDLVNISPRGDLVVTQSQSQLHFYHLDNEHPEVSWHSLWEKVWYENYPEPQYVWQSSSSSNDFEPKFSLVPLSFGTIKAAFYAMIFAAPLAILGAIFTAYFMAPTMRKVVKPTVEIMEALPTVILGFLAGLWLAPFIENHLFAIFLLLLSLPLFVLLSSLAWENLPKRYTSQFDGWQAAILAPLLILSCILVISVAPVIEFWIFPKGFQYWLLHTLKIPYDQRNSLVVGIAMGVAVIPTIFSIAEDAVFSVPKHLTLGSLALGATTWQTLSRVVILTASPGIFSAMIIGFGRAIGETMIVLMATGNTPIIDFNIFQGMRTLSANIAVEMPESEVNSTHYRILFLAALVLFVFTFFFNTIADVVRHRLRKRYSSL